MPERKHLKRLGCIYQSHPRYFVTTCTHNRRNILVHQDIHEILRTHGLRAEETGYVGDMVHDIETARHGGVTSVGVLSGYDPVGRLSAAEPKLLLACVKSLHAMLKHAADRPSEPSREGETDERIEIRRLEVSARVGVPEEERAEPQRLLVSLELIPEAPFGDLHDEISRTVDYYQVARRVRTLVAERPRKLIETLASERGESAIDLNLGARLAGAPRQISRAQAGGSVDHFAPDLDRLLGGRTSTQRGLGGDEVAEEVRIGGFPCHFVGFRERMELHALGLERRDGAIGGADDLVAVAHCGLEADLLDDLALRVGQPFPNRPRDPDGDAYPRSTY